MYILLLFFSIIFKCINYNYTINLLGLSSLANIITYFNDSYNLNQSKECIDDLRWLVDYNSPFYQQNKKMEKSSGRGIDDIGNEIECLGSNLDADYIFLQKEYNEGKSQILRLSKYLRREYTFLGLCIPKNCFSLFQDLVYKVNKFNKRDRNDSNTFGEDIDTRDEYNDFVYSFFRKNMKEIKLFIRADIEDSNLFLYIFCLFMIFFVIKVFIGIFVKIKCPKGYNYYVYKKKKTESFGDIFDDNDKESERAKFISDDNADQINKKFNLKGEYDPQFDLEPSFPFSLRIIKCLDLFNNITTFMGKRNRYYNEKNINILCSIKSILLFYHIYAETIKVMIRLPNTNSFDYDYYNTFSLFLFKRSTNSLIFWVILESATFSFKLMNFIKRKFNKKNMNNLSKRAQKNFVMKQILKFFYFYIPKIIIFIFIYLFFYRFFSKYNIKLEAKMTYQYISKRIINNKKCNGKGTFLENLLYTFIPFMNYKNNFRTDYKEVCFPFTYIYVNMFFSSIFFMIILMIIYYFQTKIVDVIIFIAAIANLIGSYIYYFINDYINNKEENNYTFGFFSGENYSIFYIHIFFSYYFIGCLLGLNFYNLSEKKNQKLKSKRSKRKTFSNTETSKNNLIKDNIDNDNDIDQKNTLYEPMEFCSNFILKLRKTKTIIKFLLLFIYFALSILIIIIINILFNKYISEISESGINITRYSYKLMTIYYWDKLINVILFSFFILLISAIQRKFLLIKILKSNFFIPVSRVGFVVTCAYQSMTFIFFCLFQLRIKNAFFIILYVAIGFYILIIIFSFIITILFELPLRIIIKNIVKSQENEGNDGNDIISKLIE